MSWRDERTFCTASALIFVTLSKETTFCCVYDQPSLLLIAFIFKTIKMEETKDLPLFMTAESYVAKGEENDVRVAKRNVCNLERFLQAGKP